MKQIEVYDYNFFDCHSDAGSFGIQFICPKCNDTLRLAEYGWWDTTCECGYDWDFKIIITGEKYE
jgi:hypothetical protein